MSTRRPPRGNDGWIISSGLAARVLAEHPAMTPEQLEAAVPAAR